MLDHLHKTSQQHSVQTARSRAAHFEGPATTRHRRPPGLRLPSISNAFDQRSIDTLHDPPGPLTVPGSRDARDGVDHHMSSFGQNSSGYHTGRNPLLHRDRMAVNNTQAARELSSSHDWREPSMASVPLIRDAGDLSASKVAGSPRALGQPQAQSRDAKEPLSSAAPSGGRSPRKQQLARMMHRANAPKQEPASKITYGGSGISKARAEQADAVPG